MKLLLSDTDIKKLYPILYWPLWGKYIVFVGSVFLVLLMSYFLVLKKNLDKLYFLKQQQSELKMMFEHKQNKALTINGYTDQLEQLKKTSNENYYYFPKLSQLDQLLVDISKLGQQEKLVFNLVDPLDAVIKDFYVELPIKISLLGQYEQIVHFLNGLSLLKQIVTIDHLELSVPAQKLMDNNNGGTVVGEIFLPNIVQMSMFAKTYYVNNKNDSM